MMPGVSLALALPELPLALVIEIGVPQGEAIFGCKGHF